MAKTFLCITSYFKGEDFIRFCKEAGNRVYLVTSKRLENEAWPREHIDEIFYMHEEHEGIWNMEHLKAGLAHTFRRIKIDRVVALDDFDVEKAAHVREYFRIPGMGETTVRYFRDKLAMRMKAQEAGIKIPAFTHLFYDEDIREYVKNVKAPWMIKPRSEASATGIQKIYNEADLWKALNALGDKRDRCLLEQFRPGDVYHVDSLSLDGKVIFTRVSQYLSPPFEVAHGGGVFRTCTVEFGSKEDKALQKLNANVMKAFGMQYSASHSEYIKCHEDGEFYFLETSSRVGGAHIAEMVEFSAGINLWGEWARLESAVANGTTYKLPPVKNENAGLIVSLSKFQHPDTAVFKEKEVRWRMKKDFHVGLIVTSDKRARVLELLDKYAHIIHADFHAAAPPQDREPR